MIDFAIYGCGVIARTHVAAMKEVPGARVVACAGRNQAATEAFAQVHGLRVLPDWKALLADETIRGVCICTPSGTHADLAVEALEAGKHVVLEKPMAISTAQCDRILAAAAHARGKITVISQHRTSGDISRAKALLDTGKLGKLLLCQLHMCYYRPESYYHGSWRGTKAMDGGGALMNQGIHGVDILLHLMGPVRQLRSGVRTLLHDIEVEDTAVAALEFESGALGVITASTATHPGFDRELRIYGTRGAMEFREGVMVRLVLDGQEQPCRSFTASGAAGDNTKLNHRGHARQLEAFVRAIHGEAVSYPDLHEGKQAVALIERIYRESMAERAPL